MHSNSVPGQDSNICTKIQSSIPQVITPSGASQAAEQSMDKSNLEPEATDMTGSSSGDSTNSDLDVNASLDPATASIFEFQKPQYMDSTKPKGHLTILDVSRFLAENPTQREALQKILEESEDSRGEKYEQLTAAMSEAYRNWASEV